MSGLKLYRALAALVEARQNCERSGNREWLEKHTDKLLKLVREHMPSGAGIDNGTQIRLDNSTPHSTPHVLRFTTAFHHMDEHGGYDGWTQHIVEVRASLTSEIEIAVLGSDRNDIKDYLHEVFHTALMTEVSL